MDDHGETWKLEKWKAAVGFFEKLFLVAFGALIVPAIMGKATYPIFAMIVGGAIAFLSGMVWCMLMFKDYSREKKL